MSREDVDVVRDRLEEALNALGRGDIDAWLDYFHPHAVYVLIGGFESLIGREFRGREEIRGLMKEWRATFEDVVLEIEQVIPADERVLVVISLRSRGRAGGVETTLRWGLLMSFRDGLVVRAENYYDVDQALEAVGLRE